MTAPDQIAQLRPVFWNPVRVASETCAVCTTPVGGYPRCYACNEHARGSSLLANLVAPLTYAVKGEQAYRDLSIYKDDRYDASAQTAARDRIWNLLYASMSTHLICIARAGGANLAVAMVPSTSGSRPGQHPLAHMLKMFGQEINRIDLHYVGSDGLERNARRELNPSSFDVVLPSSVAGKHVLLIDDSWVKGGHMQSCAAALRSAGASWVTAVPIGRVLVADFRDTVEFMAGHKIRTFDPDVCPISGLAHG